MPGRMAHGSRGSILNQGATLVAANDMEPKGELSWAGPGLFIHS